MSTNKLVVLGTLGLTFWETFACVWALHGSSRTAEGHCLKLTELGASVSQDASSEVLSMTPGTIGHVPCSATTGDLKNVDDAGEGGSSGITRSEGAYIISCRPRDFRPGKRYEK